MRKKLLSLLTVLCLVLGMLPTTALAAATEAYEKNEVAQIITEDTEITEDVDGLVLVDAPCTVTVTDAKLSVGIVVSPDAAGAEVVLNGTAESAEVVVLASASVKVAETANAGAVTVDAAEVTLEVAGTAEVALTENATDVTVTAAEGAVVTVDAAAGASVTVDVAEGAKAEVKVAEGAAATVTAAEGSTVTLDVAEGAEVSVDVAEGAEVAINGDGAEAVEVTGDGADSVTVNGETADADSEEEEDKDDADEEEEEETEDEPQYYPDAIISASTQTKSVKICWSPQGNGDQSAALSGAHTLNGATTKTTTATMTSTNGSPYRGSVNITATNLEEHNTSSSTTGSGKGYWIGFGVELPEGTYTESTNAETGPYKYYVIEKNGNTWDTAGAYHRVYKVEETFFNTLYFDVPLVTEPVTESDEGTEIEKNSDVNDVVEGNENEIELTAETPAPAHGEYIVVVTKGATDLNVLPTNNTGDGHHTEAVEGTAGLQLAAGEEIVYIFDVTIDAANTTEASSAPTTTP